MNHYSRRCFLRRSATAALLACGGRLSLAAPRPQPKLSDEDVLAQCNDRIQKHRSGDGALTVRTAGGQPVANARVRLEQTRHEFLFGCNFFEFAKIKEAALQEQYNERFAALLNYATLPFYWAPYEWRRGHPGYESTDRVIEWTRSRGILCKGHPLVWDHPAGNPPWLPDDLQEIGRLSHTRVREIVARFKGRLDIWDVVNEAVHLGQDNKEQRMSKWAVTLGATRYVAEHLRIARAANPNATLLVNDYRLDPPYVKLLDSLRDGGKLLFDVIGLQSHMHDGVWTLDKVWNLCEAHAKLGVPLHFTEATVVSGPRRGPGENWGATTPELEARQADYVASLYTTLFAHPAVHALTWWDFSDRSAWQGAAAGLLRQDMSPKPVYERLLALVKGRWWSKLDGQADAKGRLSARLCYGDYRATITLPNGDKIKRNFSWSRQTERNPVITI